MSEAATLDALCAIQSGGTPRRDTPEFWGGDVPWVTITDMRSGVINATEEHITEAGLGGSSAKLFPRGTVLLSIFATIGRTALLNIDAATNQAIAGLTIKDANRVDGSYLRRYLDFVAPSLASQGRGVAQANINLSILRSTQVPLPPLDEQRRIAAILDRADALRAKRRGAIAKLDQLLQSVFLDMFGDPVANPKGWEMVGIAEMAEVLRDGPFGSNLKSEHYQPTGVRVIRLQNIGVWKFLAEDVAYVSEDHFHSLPRNHCRPGDVLVGTLGDPNLRACILPSHVDRALNKADCLLFRVKQDVATAEYICGLLNSEALISSASGLALGQTRLRVSMGRLKELVVPMPPVVLQRQFSDWCERLHKEQVRALSSLAMLDRLFESLQINAFSDQHGEATEAT